MTTDPRPPLRVALAAAPRLLAESLRALLADTGVQVVLLPDTTHETFDIAIVTESDHSIPAELTILLDDGPDRQGTASLFGRDGSAIAVIEGLPAIVEFVQAHGSHRRPGLGPTEGQYETGADI